MKLIINGEERELSARVRTIEELLRVLNIPAERGGIAVARNASVVPRARWGQEPLQAGDSLEIITAVQGG